MFIFNLFMGVVFAINLPENKSLDEFDFIELATGYKEVKIKKYQKMMEKAQYEKLITYYTKQQGFYSSSDRAKVHTEFYIPALIANAANINTFDAWHACLAEIPKSPVYARYRMKFPFIEEVEHERTVKTKTFEEWQWFLSLYESSKNAVQYTDEYEVFHFDEIKEEGDIDLLLDFLEVHPNGKLYTEAFKIYNVLLIEKCKIKYDTVMASSNPDDVRSVIKFFNDTLKHSADIVKLEVQSWLERVQVKLCELEPSKECYEDFISQNPGADSTFLTMAQTLYEDFVYTTAKSDTEWKFFIERFPESVNLDKAKQSLRDVRFAMVSENRNSLEEEDIVFVESFIVDYPDEGSALDSNLGVASDYQMVVDILDEKLFKLSIKEDTLESWTRYIEYVPTLSKVSTAEFKRGEVYYRLYTEQKKNDVKNMSRDYLTNACNVNLFQACFEEGELLLSVSVSQALKRLNLACDNNIDASCLRLAELYLQGQKVKKSTSAGRKYYLTSCARDGAGCDRLVDMWEKGKSIPVDEKSRLQFANRAVKTCSDSRQGLCVKIADTLLGHKKGYSLSGDVADYFRGLDDSFSFIRSDKGSSKMVSGSTSTSDVHYEIGRPAYYCMGRGGDGVDGRETWAQKVIINTLTEGENLLSVSLVDSLGVTIGNPLASCEDNDQCFDVENFIIDYDELSPTAKGCGSVVREIEFSEKSDDSELSSDDAVSKNSTDQNTSTLNSWVSKTENNIVYSMDVNFVVPKMVQDKDSFKMAMRDWFLKAHQQKSFAFDGIESIEIPGSILCDKRYDVCSAFASLKVYRNTSVFRQPIRLERHVQAYSLYNSVCKAQLKSYVDVDKGDVEEWACLNSSLLSRALSVETRLLSLNNQTIPELALPFEQLVARRCLLESKKKLRWELQSCDLASSSLNLLDSSYVSVLSKSCDEKNYKACGEIGNLEYKAGKQSAAMPKLKKACDNGDKASCSLSYQHYSSLNDVLQEYFGIKACNLGTAYGCTGVSIDYWNQASQLYRDAEYYGDGGFLAESEKYFSKAYTYSRKGCKLDDTTSCLLYGYSLAHKGSEDSAKREYDKVCHKAEKKGCIKLYTNYSFGSKVSASIDSIGRYRTSTRALLKGVKGYKTTRYDRIKLQFDVARQGTPAVTTKLKSDDSGNPYLELVMHDTEGVVVRGAKMYKSYSKNYVAVSGKVVKSVSNMGDASGISSDGKLMWKVGLINTDFSNVVIVIPQESSSSYNSVYIDVVY